MSVVRSQLLFFFYRHPSLFYYFYLLLLSPNLTASAAVAWDGLPQREMQRAASDSSQSRDRGTSDSDANADTMDSQEVGEMCSTALCVSLLYAGVYVCMHHCFPCSTISIPCSWRRQEWSMTWCVRYLVKCIESQA